MVGQGELQVRGPRSGRCRQFLAAGQLNNRRGSLAHQRCRLTTLTSCMNLTFLTTITGKVEMHEPRLLAHQGEPDFLGY